MIRAGKRVFRFAFPLVLGAFFILFLSYGNPSVDAKQPPDRKIKPEKPIESGVASGLRISSRDATNGSGFKLEAVKAKQTLGKIDLSLPKGLMERGRESSTLTANHAEYHERAKIVKFVENVSFEHSSGLSAKSRDAVLATDTRNIYGKNGITAFHKQTKVTGDSYLIETAKNKLSVRGGACLRVRVADRSRR